MAIQTLKPWQAHKAPGTFEAERRLYAADKGERARLAYRMALEDKWRQDQLDLGYAQHGSLDEYRGQQIDLSQQQLEFSRAQQAALEFHRQQQLGLDRDRLAQQEALERARLDQQRMLEQQRLDLDKELNLGRFDLEREKLELERQRLDDLNQDLGDLPEDFARAVIAKAGGEVGEGVGRGIGDRVADWLGPAAAGAAGVKAGAGLTATGVGATTGTVGAEIATAMQTSGAGTGLVGGVPFEIGPPTGTLPGTTSPATLTPSSAITPVASAAPAAAPAVTYAGPVGAQTAVPAGSASLGAAATGLGIFAGGIGLGQAIKAIGGYGDTPPKQRMPGETEFFDTVSGMSAREISPEDTARELNVIREQYGEPRDIEGKLYTDITNTPTMEVVDDRLNITTYHDFGRTHQDIKPPKTYQSTPISDYVAGKPIEFEEVEPAVRPTPSWAKQFEDGEDFYWGFKDKYGRNPSQGDYFNYQRMGRY